MSSNRPDVETASGAVRDAVAGGARRFLGVPYVIADDLAWEAAEWDARESVYAWGPRPPRGFFAADGGT